MKQFCLFLFICLCISISNSQSQNNILRGFVKLQSSGSKPLSDVKISTFGAGSVHSKSNGQFELIFPNKKPGASLSLIVDKEGYELINDKAVENCVLKENPDDFLIIVMAKKGERDKQALLYYNIIIENAK